MSVYLFIFSNRGSLRVIFFFTGATGTLFVWPICVLIGGRVVRGGLVVEDWLGSWTWFWTAWFSGVINVGCSEGSTGLSRVGRLFIGFVTLVGSWFVLFGFWTPWLPLLGIVLGWFALLGVFIVLLGVSWFWLGVNPVLEDGFNVLIGDKLAGELGFSVFVEFAGVSELLVGFSVFVEVAGVSVLLVGFIVFVGVVELVFVAGFIVFVGVVVFVLVAGFRVFVEVVVFNVVVGFNVFEVVGFSELGEVGFIVLFVVEVGFGEVVLVLKVGLGGTVDPFWLACIFNG